MTPPAEPGRGAGRPTARSPAAAPCPLPRVARAPGPAAPAPGDERAVSLEAEDVERGHRAHRTPAAARRAPAPYDRLSRIATAPDRVKLPSDRVKPPSRCRARSTLRRWRSHDPGPERLD